jgi:hypothetical protein
MRLKRDALDVVFEEQRDVRENVFQRAAEFREIEFVHVKRVGAVGAARFGVVQLVGRRDDQLAAGREHAARFQQKLAPGFQMLDHLEGHHQVEGPSACGSRSQEACSKARLGSA